MTAELRTVWRIRGVEPHATRFDVQLVVDTTAEVVVEAIEAAAAAHGVELERVEPAEVSS